VLYPAELRGRRLPLPLHLLGVRVTILCWPTGASEPERDTGHILRAGGPSGNASGRNAVAARPIAETPGIPPARVSDDGPHLSAAESRNYARRQLHPETARVNATRCLYSEAEIRGFPGCEDATVVAFRRRDRVSGVLGQSSADCCLRPNGRNQARRGGAKYRTVGNHRDKGRSGPACTDGCP
jgi:hypothetical protein